MLELFCILAIAIIIILVYRAQSAACALKRSEAYIQRKVKEARTIAQAHPIPADALNRLCISLLNIPRSYINSAPGSSITHDCLRLQIALLQLLDERTSHLVYGSNFVGVTAVRHLSPCLWIEYVYGGTNWVLLNQAGDVVRADQFYNSGMISKVSYDITAIMSYLDSAQTS